MYSLEPLGQQHRQPVIDILNAHIVHGQSTFFEKPIGTALFDLLLQAVGDYPARAALWSGTMAGFSLLRPYHSLPIFRRTAKISTFFAPDHMGKGLGALLLNEMETLARTHQIDTLLASIADGNDRSLRFHAQQGFHLCGSFFRVGTKQGKDLDVLWMQKLL